MEAYLTEQEIKRIGEGNTGSWQDDLQFARAIESAVLAKLKAQEPMCWMTPSGEGWMMRTEPPVIDTKLGWTALYEHPLPPDDVVRDAERLEWLMNSGRIVICDREGCYTYTHTSGRYGPVAKTQREAIDLAMEEMK